MATKQGSVGTAPGNGNYFIMIPHTSRVRVAVAIQVSLIDKQEHIEQAARALKSISHPLRLKILCVIGDQEACVQEIVEAVGTSQSNISQHLAKLRAAKILDTRKDGNLVYYRVADTRTLELVSSLQDLFCSQPPEKR